MKKPKYNRSIRINGIDKELEIEGGAIINITNEAKSFIHIEKMKSGKYKLFVTKDLTDDLTKIESLEIIRDD